MFRTEKNITSYKINTLTYAFCFWQFFRSSVSRRLHRVFDFRIHKREYLCGRVRC